MYIWVLTTGNTVTYSCCLSHLVILSFTQSQRENLFSQILMTVIYQRLHLFYDKDRSVLLENTPLVEFIRDYIRDPSGVFSISSLVRILMTSFPSFLRLFVQTVGKKMASDRFVYITKRKHRWLEDMNFIFSC